MELAGLALGGLGVVGIFSSCIQAFDMVQIARTQDRSLYILATKLDNQKARFWIWGQARGLDDPEGYDQRLNHPILRDRIKPNCALLYQILSESNQLKTRYGLKEDSSPEGGYMLTSGGDEGSVWQVTFRRIQARIATRQRRHVTRWIIKDQNAFKDLVQDLRELIDDLESLTNFPDVAQKQRIITSFEVESIADDDSISILQESVADEEDELSEVASVRALALPSEMQREAAVSRTDDVISQATAPALVSLGSLSSSPWYQRPSDFQNVDSLKEEASRNVPEDLTPAREMDTDDEATGADTTELNVVRLSSGAEDGPSLRRRHGRNYGIRASNEQPIANAHTPPPISSSTGPSVQPRPELLESGKARSHGTNGRPIYIEDELESSANARENSPLQRSANNLREAVAQLLIILPPADRAVIEKLGNNAQGVHETVADVEMRWQLARRSGEFRNVRYAWMKCCSFLKHHYAVLQLIPEGYEYFALLTSAMKHIIYATSNHERSAFVVSKALWDMGHGMELCFDIDVLSATDKMQMQVNDLYSDIFLYLKGALDGIRTRRMQGTLEDVRNDLDRDQENLMRNILKILKAIENHLRTGIAAEERLASPSVENTRADAQRVLTAMRDAVPRQYRDPRELERLMLQHRAHQRRVE